MKKIILMLASLFWGMILPIMAQQIVIDDEFEIELPEGWIYYCAEEPGIIKHSFKKDSLSYMVNVLAMSVYTNKAFEEYLPLGTKYVEVEEVQILEMEDGGDVEFKKVQGDDSNPNTSGGVYVINRNDKAIVIQEINRNDSLAVNDNLLELFRWSPKIVSLPFWIRVEWFCDTMNSLIKELTSVDGLHFEQAAKGKKMIIEYHLKKPEDEAKVLAEGKLKKKDEVISELLFESFPFLEEMGNEGYSFQFARYLMNGKLESKVIYKPKDYKHLIEERNQYVSFTIRLIDDDE